MAQREIPSPGSFYRHFKNKLYQVIAVAAHSETGEQMVVYQALYGTFGCYVRPLSMFLSEVDHDKYPEASQQYRFERVSVQEVSDAFGAGGDNGRQTDTAAYEKESAYAFQEAKDQTKDRNLTLEFLDAEGNRAKLDFIKENLNKIDRKTAEDIAVSLDLNAENRPTEELLRAIRDNLEMMLKFEGRRP